MQIQIEHRPAALKLDVMGVYDWPMQSLEPGEFVHDYAQAETCYILSGSATLTPANGPILNIERGDLISFPAGLSCTWTIHSPVKTHYTRG